jgi:dTDP-4-dehydrorhamnose reductase
MVTYLRRRFSASDHILNTDKWIPGIYNYSNEGELVGMNLYFLQEIGANGCEVNGIPSSSYPTPAKRPAFSLLDKSELKRLRCFVPGYKEFEKM